MMSMLADDDDDDDDHDDDDDDDEEEEKEKKGAIGRDVARSLMLLSAIALDTDRVVATKNCGSRVKRRRRRRRQ